jgi:drug/metabolite transporter (DMT)-like permease
VVALGGVAVMAAGAGRGATHGTAAVDPAGVSLGLLAAGLYAGAVLIQKSLLRELDAVTVTWLGCVVGLVALLSFAGQLAGQLPSAPAGAVLGTVYLGALPTAVAFTTWAYALRRLPAGRLSPIGYLVTVVSVLLSWLLLGEVPTGTALAGGALCVLGVAIGRRGAGRPVPLRKWTPPVRRSRASRSAASTLGG